MAREGNGYQRSLLSLEHNERPIEGALTKNEMAEADEEILDKEGLSTFERLEC